MAKRAQGKSGKDFKNKGKFSKDNPKKSFRSGKPKKGGPMPKTEVEEIRLNKYLANAGVCSRREADVLIKSGVVRVNGKIVTELGTKVMPTDKIQYDGETLNLEKPQYFLLNKPKNHITTMDDPRGRKTVMQIMSKACKERVYPVGRLDRNTTGLLLFTNDGDLAKKLTHPRYKAKKIYHVFTDQPVDPAHLIKLEEGVQLEDGIAQADKAEFVKNSDSRREVGVEMHSGKYRVVRRMFEALGYKVNKLDRVFFAGLTKQNLPRGHYRPLTEAEIKFLKMSK